MTRAGGIGRTIEVFLSFISTGLIILSALLLILSILFLLHSPPVFSEETLPGDKETLDAIDEELRYLKAETYVITPSKILQRIEKAPGTIHVVTDRQIRQMGARYLSDVVETVPGWYVWKNSYGGTMLFVRGDSGTGGNKVLVMVNSHPVNDVSDGSAQQLYSLLDLDNVKQIEFVNSPASALYGSGAMAGIINIITKDGEDVDGLHLTGRGGSFNTWEGSALFGKTIQGLEVAAYLDYRITDGFRGHVEQDRQSVLDELYGTQASLAPGNMKGDLDQWDAQLTLKYKSFKFDGKYLDRKNDLPLGAWPTLDNMSDSLGQQYYLNLSYDVTVTEGLNLMAKVYRTQDEVDILQQIWPEGSWWTTPNGPELTTKNIFWEFGNKNSRMGVEAQATYEIMYANTIVGGITYEEQRLYDDYKKGNFAPSSTPGVRIPLPAVQDLPDKYVIPDKKRDFWAVYVEDTWDILEDLRLTIGGRYDHYSDFGGEFSPRVGVNWEFVQNVNTKFLYGRAFRAPTFGDLYDTRLGNPNLKPETENTYELSLGAGFFPFSGEVTVFHKKIKDYIGTAAVGNPPTYKFLNVGEITTKGFTLQMKYDLGKGTYLGMNYTHIDREVRYRGRKENSWIQPERQGTVSANVRLNRYLNLNTYMLYRGGWVRDKADIRDDPEDYVLVNATLTAKNLLKSFKGLEVRGSVYNLFDKEYTSPTAPGELPDDMPMADRHYLVEVRYRF